MQTTYVNNKGQLMPTKQNIKMILSMFASIKLRNTYTFCNCYLKVQQHAQILQCFFSKKPPTNLVIRLPSHSYVLSYLGCNIEEKGTNLYIIMKHKLIIVPSKAVPFCVEKYLFLFCYTNTTKQIKVDSINLQALHFIELSLSLSLSMSGLLASINVIKLIEQGQTRGCVGSGQNQRGEAPI